MSNWQPTREAWDKLMARRVGEFQALEFENADLKTRIAQLEAVVEKAHIYRRALRSGEPDYVIAGAGLEMESALEALEQMKPRRKSTDKFYGDRL